MVDNHLSYKDRRWYTNDNKPEDVYKKLFTEVDRIQEKDSGRIETIMDACALYGDASAFHGLYGTVSLNTLSDELTHNIIAPAVDTLAAEVTQSRQRPIVVTIGGSPKDIKNARSLTHFVDGKWDLCDVDSTVYQCVLDSIITGCGIARVYRSNEMEPENDSSAVERIFPGNLIMDDRWCVDTMPRDFYVKRFIDRAHLADLYPSKADEIWQVQNSERAYYNAVPDEDSNVEVVEAIHLASAPGRDDGRRVISIRNTVLVDRKHDRTDTDYIFLRGMPARLGWWGESIALRAAPAQLELNKMCYRMQEGHHLLTTPKVFVNRQSGILNAHLTNDIGTVIEYDGEPPLFHTPQAFNAEFYKHIERLEGWVFKELGISELSAVSKKPVGLDSGAALRMYSDIQTRRWINYVARYERFCEDIARNICLKEKEIAEENPSHSVQVFIAKKKVYDEFKWRDIELDPERIRLRIFSASALPNTPAGKLQALEEMVKTGVIDQQTFIRLADIPDFESVRDLLVAGEELMRESFQKMLDEPKYFWAPEPTLDLQQGRMIASQMAHRAELVGYEQEEIQKLHTWIDDSMALEEFVKQQAAIDANNAMQMAMGTMPNPQGPTAPPPGVPMGGPQIPAMPPGGGMGPSTMPDMSVLPGQPASPQPFTGIPPE